MAIKNISAKAEQVRLLREKENGISKGARTRKPISPERIDRARIFGTYILENNATIRTVAEYFDFSKSTVHKDIVEVLPQVLPDLFAKVQKVIECNKDERGLRGGYATKQRYDKIRDENYMRMLRASQTSV